MSKMAIIVFFPLNFVFEINFKASVSCFGSKPFKGNGCIFCWKVGDLPVAMVVFVNLNHLIDHLRDIIYL